MHAGHLFLTLAAFTLFGCDRARTYASSCSTPLPGWRTPANGWHNVIRNQISIASAGDLRWNGKRVAREELRAILAQVPAMDPIPATVLNIAPEADCAVVESVREDMEQALSCSVKRLCGEGHGDWDAPPPVIISDDETAAMADKMASEIDKR